MSPVERLVADHIASGTVRAEMIRELSCAFATVCDDTDATALELYDALLVVADMVRGGERVGVLQ